MTAEAKTKPSEALLLAIAAIHEAIHAAGPHGIPSGHLYAALMGKLSLELYNMFIDVLIKAGKIKQQNFLLTSIVKPGAK